MPAIYFRHELIQERALRAGYGKGRGLYAIPKHLVAHALDVNYIIIVDGGKAWAARSITKVRATSEQRVIIKCIHYSDEVTGRQILLKHFLLGL